ncbi:unnamed protein product [Phaeothamnion confervicola]
MHCGTFQPAPYKHCSRRHRCALPPLSLLPPLQLETGSGGRAAAEERGRQRLRGSHVLVQEDVSRSLRWLVILLRTCCVRLGRQLRGGTSSCTQTLRKTTLSRKL